jgi:uncharacterized membrane protein
MSTTSRQNDRGATLPIVALLLPVLMVMTGFAVDLGRQRSDRRSMQAAADVISLDMARLIGDDTMREIRDRKAEIQSALTASAERNGLKNATVTAMSGPRVSLLEWGILNVTSRKFEALTPIGNSDPRWDVVPEAVRVTTADTTDYMFQPGSGDVVRTSVARTGAAGGPGGPGTPPDEGGNAVAGFTIGSRLASVDTQQSVLLNAVLSGIFTSGSGVSLTAVDYNALAGTHVALSDISAKLGAGSPEALLGATVKVRDLYVAVADALSLKGQTAAATVVNKIALAVDANANIAISKLVQVAAGAEDAAVTAGLDVFSLITSSAFVINGTNLISVPNLAVTIPGLLDLDMTLKVIERPQWAFGPELTTKVTTSQVELTLTPQIQRNLNVGLASARVEAKVPLTLTAAGADATLSDIDCSDHPGITVSVASQMVNKQLGIDVDTYGKLLLGLIVVPLVQADGTLSVPTASGASSTRFDNPTQFLPDAGTGTMVAVPPPGLGLGGILSGSNLQTAGTMTVKVVNLDIGWVAGDILGPVATALNPVLGSIEQLVVTPLTTALGIQLGGGDVGALGMICPPEQADLVG